MSSSKLVVTVALFTVLEDIDLFTVPSSMISLGPESGEKFGMGLFVVTRRENRDANLTLTNKRVLPASDVLPSESIDQAAQRLVQEELGIQSPVRLRQERTFENPARQAGERVISITYWGFANLEDVAPLLGGKEKVGLELVNSSEFLATQSAKSEQTEFDGICRFGFRYSPGELRGHTRSTRGDQELEPVLDVDHDEMVFLSWRRLRHAFGGKLDPFRFLGATALPEAFRLSDLRELSDVCRGERSQADQFRRSILNESSFISPSLEAEEKVRRPGKPAVLYSLREWADPTKGSTISNDELD